MTNADLEDAFVTSFAHTPEEAAQMRAAVATASQHADDDDRLHAVGNHPYFGWVARDAEDFSSVGELSHTVLVSSFGVETSAA